MAFLLWLALGVVAIVVASPIERRLAARGWDVPRRGTQQGLALALWLLVTPLVAGGAGVPLAVIGAVGLVAYAVLFRRSASAEPEERGVRVLHRYLQDVERAGPLVQGLSGAERTADAVVEGIATIRPDGDGWRVDLDVGRSARVRFDDGGRAVVDAADLGLGAAKGQDEASLGDIHLALRRLASTGRLVALADGRFAMDLDRPPGA